MLIKSFVAGPWQTNCYVVAPQANSECVIIDPGQNALSGIKSLILEEKLKPVAVLVTHGHLDHMWSVFPVAQGYEIPAFVHNLDRHLLADPAAGLSAQTRAMLPQMLGKDDVFAEPSAVIEVTDNLSVNIAGLEFGIRHTPGHTAGSVIFSALGPQISIFTGDTLFAGAIGRTDLPGSSPEAMNRTLRDIICKLPEDALVFPGHGPATRMETELNSNHYLLRAKQGLPVA